MKKWIWIGVVAVVVIFFYATYNGFVNKEEGLKGAWSNVETQYQRRADLIPNLVNTVKGYAAHESETLESVTNARAGLTKAYNEANEMTAAEAQQNVEAFQQRQSALKGALDIYVNAVREAYPDLKANENFMNLQAQLEGTENRIATERMRYNEAVEVYNKMVLRFPGNIFAGLFGFDRKDMFKAEEGAQHAPKVEF